MELTFAQASSAGPVRPTNEDFLGFWQPEDAEEQRSRGALAVLADGVGGHGQGDVASRLAVEAVLGAFTTAKPGTPAKAGTPAKTGTAAKPTAAPKTVRHPKPRPPH